MKTADDINKGIASFFKCLRIRRGLSKSRMAEIVDVDDKTWSRYEAGQTSPSVGEFMQICESVGEDPLKPVLDMVYPTTYASLSPASDAEKLRNAASDYFLHVASDKTVREWDYLLFGHHGSAIEPQMQMFTMIDHLPMEYRVLIAELVRSSWEIASARGELIGLSNVMPDIDVFDAALKKGKDAAFCRMNSYSSL